MFLSEIKIPKIIINIYNDRIFTLFFLFSLLFFGNKNIKLTLILAIIWIFIGQIINEQELLINI